MSKITKDDITGPTGLGFTKELFAPIVTDDTAFDGLVDAVIAAQSAELSDRIGATVYNLAANATYVKKAEKCLVAAELVQRRINISLGNAVANGDKLDTTAFRLQRKDYLDEAEEWIGKLAQGVTTDPTSDFASGALVSSHFDTTT